MRQGYLDVQTVQAWNQLERLLDLAESMTDEEYKDFKIADFEQHRTAQIANVSDMARTPDAVYADQLCVIEEITAFLLQQFRGISPNAVFEQQVQALRETPAAQLKTDDLMLLRSLMRTEMLTQSRQR